MDYDCDVCASSRDGRKHHLDGVWLTEAVVDLDGVSVPVEIYGDFWINKYLCSECLRKLMEKLKAPIQAKLWRGI